MKTSSPCIKQLYIHSVFLPSQSHKFLPTKYKKKDYQHTDYNHIGIKINKANVDHINKNHDICDIYEYFDIILHVQRRYNVLVYNIL